ncbi:SidA/IucD/PvdA family monooxygenase [Gordonia sinesedis]
MSEQERLRDVVGVGFGPGNLGLAVALSELDTDGLGASELGVDTDVAGIDAVFLEQQPGFAWHPGMLLPGTNMQISFLKDLVTQRNPQSCFSFVSYLKEHGRLTGFINRQTFTPERVEFADYLRWVAGTVGADVRYRRRVIAVEPAGTGAAAGMPDGARFAVTAEVEGSSEIETYFARAVVVARGLHERLPGWAYDEKLTQCGRVFHNHRFLDHLAALPRPVGESEFLVVGGGQSAAEVVAYLHGAGAGVSVAFTAYGMAPADDSPFANQVFDPVAVDDFYAAPDDVRADLVRRHRYTNYACVEPELLTELHDRTYRESITGDHRLRVRRSTEVIAATPLPDGRVQVELFDRIHRVTTHEIVDAVVCATGFVSHGLVGISAFGERVRVSRDYHAVVDGIPVAGLFVQGATEDTHGLGSTLLSNIAVRAGELRASILADIGAPQSALADA